MLAIVKYQSSSNQSFMVSSEAKKAAWLVPKIKVFPLDEIKVKCFGWKANWRFPNLLIVQNRSFLSESKSVSATKLVLEQFCDSVTWFDLFENWLIMFDWLRFYVWIDHLNARFCSHGCFEIVIEKTDLFNRSF